MDTDLIWGTAIALEIAVLFRGFKAALLQRYLLFYAYVGCVLLIEVLRFCSHRFTPTFYPAFFWHSELVTIVASYAVVLEIFRQALRHHAGVALRAQKLLLVIFVIALTYAATDLLHGGFHSAPRATADLGRYLRYIEGALLFALLWLFDRYRLHFGRNLLGLTIGYSLMIGLDVINLALLSFRGNESSVGLRNLLPITFLITLAIWCLALWSAQPDPLRQPENAIERDYQLLATKTSAALRHVSDLLSRTLRP